MIGLLIGIFIVGYLLIAMEHITKINKAAIALLTGGLCWTVYILFTQDKELVNENLVHHIGNLSGILFFLLSAMTIVELIDAHEGFDMITSQINATNKRKLLWLLAFITFFLSAILDNLTTTIVIVSLLRKLISNPKDRMLFTGIVVIAANSGGAWSPIGDVTTTMLWIEGQITTGTIISQLILPSLVSLLVPLIVLTFMMKGNITKPENGNLQAKSTLSKTHKSTVLILGIVILMLVPVFKTFTHLPPYIGILIGLGVLWLITEIMHSGKDDEDKHPLSVHHALEKIDTPSILFFLGILISISALESTHILHNLANWLDSNLGHENLIVFSLGILSSIVDNVPLVAAAQAMYDLNTYPTDHSFWVFLAYCTGTGGSILIIGSAAGVAAMGIEKVPFFWYLKNISLLAILGYAAGAGFFLLQQMLFN